MVYQEVLIMKPVLQKQIDEMTEDELKEVLRRDFVRKLTGYRMTDDFYKKKYNMDFASFQKANVVEKQNYTFEVESDAQEWELAIDGIETVNMKVFIDNELFIQIYGNTKKDKLNLALVFKRKRLYGYDSEGGTYHCHPFDDPDKHIFVDNRKSIREFL
jgi:hypothetical protein